MARPKTKTHRVRPSLSPELIAEVAKLFVDQQAERERQRLDVFNRAWAYLPESRGKFELRVALAVAYLGGSK